MIDPDGYAPADPLPGFDDIDLRIRPRIDDLSVVIPTLGRPILEKCLASMVAGESWPESIVVVDQGEGDGVANMLSRVEQAGIPTKRIAVAPCGRAAALNLGVEQVTTTYFAITDDDCVVAPDWLTCMREALGGHPGSIISGRIEDAGDEEPIANALSLEYELRTKPSLLFDVMSGGNVGMATSSFEQAGPFDEDPLLRLAEDTEYAYRALRAGIRLAYVPDVRVWHYAWRDRAQRAAQYRGYARSHGSYYGKYIRRGDVFIAFKSMIHLARATRRWARSRLRGDENMADHAKAYTTQLVPGILDGIRGGVGAAKP